MSLDYATRESAAVWLQPILITALVACVGLLPAAASHAIGSDRQLPFAQSWSAAACRRASRSRSSCCRCCTWWASRSGDRPEV